MYTQRLSLISKTRILWDTLWDTVAQYKYILRDKVIMGWLRSVGSLKLQVSFAKEPYKKDYILQKRPIILRRLLIVATP